MSHSDELKLGVIGAGGRGGLATLAHRPEEGVRIVAAMDVRDSSFEWMKTKVQGLWTTKDYRQLLDRSDIDAVFITSPDFTHEEYTIAALEAGKHVYLEKPMAITIEGCDRILEQARRVKKKLYLGHNMRHFNVIRKIKECIDRGDIGEPKAGWCRHFVSYGGGAYFRDWHSERKNTTGLLLQKGSHDIDILHWLLHGYTKRVTAMGGLTLYDKITDRRSPDEYGEQNCGIEIGWPPLSMTRVSPKIDIEDISMMLMELDNGVFASYQQCHYTPDSVRNYTVIGTQGRIENFGDGPGESVVRIWNRKQYYNAYGDVQWFVPHVEGGHGGGDPSIVDEFIRYIRESAKIATSPVAARYSVAAGYQATMSLRNGSRPMDIPRLSQDIAEYFEQDVLTTIK